MKVEIVCDHICQLGEGPLWDARRKQICWVDILNGEIQEYSVEQKMLRTIPVHQMVGAIALCKNGNFIAALEHGFGFVNRQTEEIHKIGDPESDLPNNRFNDGKCDPSGRFWAGTMSFDESPAAGNVYVLKTDLSFEKKINAVTVSNGMAWSLDHRNFYYIDSPSFKVVAYLYDDITGNISNKKTIIEISEEEGSPDGMTIDQEGMLWIAHWGGWKVTRWNPATGKKLDQISLPVSKVTSCAFGGDHLEDLYISSARVGLTPEELQKQPLAGSLFVIRNCGCRGIPGFEFPSAAEPVASGKK